MAPTLSWVDASGAETVIAAEGVPNGVIGRGLPPVRPLVATQPNRAGAVYSGALHGVRRVSVPLEIIGTQTSGADTRTAIRAWAARLATLTAPGKLRATTELGDQREITAWYVGGLELVETALGYYQQATVEFDCPDPYWVDTVDSVASVAGGAASSALFFPLPPLYLSASEIAAEVVIDNSGDLECYPTLSITGPATLPALRNLTTGQLLALDVTIGATEVVTLDTRSRTVLRQDGASLYPLLTSRGWWNLAKGSNRVRLEATGTTAASQLSVRWRRRWFTV